MRWLVRAYLRVRLHKINTNVMSILDSPELAARLSDAELNYAKGYVTLIDAHMTSQMTDRLEQGPAEMRRLRPDELRKLTPTPNESTHVFCRVLEHIGAFDAGGCAAAALRAARAVGGGGEPSAPQTRPAPSTPRPAPPSSHARCRARSESIELQAGDVRVLRYHQVEPLLLDERLALV